MNDACVYFAEKDGRIKIGTSINLRRRLRVLGATYLAAISGSYTEEREMHQRFSLDCIEGEWFAPSPLLMEYVGCLPPWSGLETPAPVEPPVGTNTVAEWFHVTPDTVRRWADDELVPHFRTPGGQRRFRRADLEPLLATANGRTA